MSIRGYCLFACGLLAVGSALAGPSGNWPEMRAGRWETKIDMGGRSFASSACLSEETIRRMQAGKPETGNAQKCGTPEFSTQAGGVFLSRIRCDSGEYLIKQTVLSDDRRRLETTSRQPGKPEQTMVSEMRYLGACK